MCIISKSSGKKQLGNLKIKNDPKSKWYNSEGITLTALDFLDFKSPDGNIWRVSVSNAGAVLLTDI